LSLLNSAVKDFYFLAQVSDREPEQGTDQPENADRPIKDIKAPGRIATLDEEFLHVIRTGAAAF
jgi:hypothetical protein